MNYAGLIVMVLLLCVSTTSHGAALGGAALGEPHDEQMEPQNEKEQPRPLPEQPQNTSMFGYGIGAASTSVDDPEGDTNAIMAIQPVTLIYTSHLRNKVRYWSEFYYYQASLDPDLNKIGQDLQRYGIRLSMQRGLQVSPQWSLWYGAGLDASHVKYTSRHTVDIDGFLLRRYPDRDEMTTALTINILAERSISRAWTVGLKFEQSFPASGDIKTSTLAAVTLLYKY